MTGRRAAAWALLAVAIIGAMALGRLTTDPQARQAMLLAAVAGELVAAAALRRFHRVVALCTGTVVVVLVALVASVPTNLTWHRLPTLAAVRGAVHALSAVGPLHVPVPGGPGVVCLGALVAGMAGVATRILPGGSGLVPAVALVIWSTVADPSVGGVALTLALVAAGAVVLLAGSGDRVGWLVTAGSVLTAALCAVLVGASALAGGGPGAGAAAPGGAGRPAVPPTALSLLTDLTGLQAHDPDLVLFTAATPFPTYWQVAALTVLHPDLVWAPDAATVADLEGVPARSPASAPPGVPTFGTAVSVANLSSRLLPVPPGTLRVPGAVVTDGAVVGPRTSMPGLGYTAVSLVPRAVPAGATTVGDPTPATDTALPALPGGLVTLAHLLTVTATTPLAKAEALTDWFRSGAFHYSLTARPASLAAFLLSTRTGSCQQFAGAFALLARIDGLPARVAVGFTTGHREPSGDTVVRGVDAHAWPQVYLGGRWISFEPTPAQPSGELAPPGVLGPAGQGTPNPTGPVRLPKGYRLPPPPPPSTTTLATAPSPVWWWTAGAAALVMSAALVWLLRRHRRRRTRPPATRVRLAFLRTDRALARSGRTRAAWVTPTAHAAALERTEGGRGDQLDAALADLAMVAALLERSVYAAEDLGPDDAAAAEAAARRAVRTLRHAGRRQPSPGAVRQPIS